MDQRCGTLNLNISESCAAASAVITLRQVRNGTRSFPSASNGRYPCIMPEIPSAASFVSFAPCRASASAAHFAYASLTPASISSSE